MRTKERPEKIKKNRWKGWVIALSVILVLVLVIAIPIKVHQVDKDVYGNTPNWTSTAQFDINSYKSIEISSTAKSLKVMQLADPQMKFGWMTQDVKTMDLIDKAIDDQKPDIVVCTGDLSCGITTYATYKYFADFMEKKQQYWTITYGNHDSQFDCSKYTLWKLLRGYKYCLFDCGPSNVYGESNHIVNVKQNGKIVYSLIMLDSNMYPESGSGLDWVYDWIHTDQIEWYNWVIKGLQAYSSDIRSSAFFHIPTIEFAKMYYADNPNKAIADGIDTTQLAVISNVSGTVCELDKTESELVDKGYNVGIFYGGENSQQGRTVGQGSDIFKAIKDGGATEGIFCGHDHANTLRGFYDGVYLCYGRCSGYHTYPFFTKPNLITKIIGGDDSIRWNMQKWVDEEGNVLDKGVTMINVDLTGTFGSISATDIPHSQYK